MLSGSVLHFYTAKIDKWDNGYDMRIIRVMNKSWFHELAMLNIWLWDNVSDVEYNLKFVSKLIFFTYTGHCNYVMI